MHAVVLMLIMMNTFAVKSETLQTDMYEVANDISKSVLRVCRKTGISSTGHGNAAYYI